MTKSKTAKPTNRTYRALKSLYRDREDERSLFLHEHAEIDRLIDLGWAAWSADDDYAPLVLTRRGKAEARKRSW